MLRRNILLPTLIVAALLIVVALWARSRPEQRVAPEMATLPPLTGLESCAGQHQFTERIACARPILEAHLAARGPRVVLADLDQLQAEKPVFAAQCHDLAHIIGRSWVANGGSVAEGFRAGSNVCHSGFFHGMVERVIRGDEVLGAEPLHVSPSELKATVPTICRPAALRSESRNIRFQCLHGLGHAVVFSLGYRLPLALEVCDTLGGRWEQSSCWGGAFMENITGVERERRMVRAGDAHYPCSAVAERYRDSCYGMQTSWMLEDGLGWEEIIAACREAGRHRAACFQSFGRDLSPRVRQEGPGSYAPRCTGLRPEERTPCIRGAVAALSDHTWDGRYAFPFCAAFEDPSLRAECFALAQTHLTDALEQPVEKLTRDCATYAAAAPECVSAVRAQAPAERR